MISGLEWVKVVANGARLKYIKYFNKLIHSKKSEQNNSNENSPYNPSSPYSASKASSDHLVRAWGRNEK